ncbi:hypothetical protein THIX_30418 [Thiomonas sp. X19]|uniref:hypothetical protein n=1 Tax=Thiomonas sp. X19 TaxID=1050370 RepID=UPI000B6752DC|nr:hypothetical protein [Thiomonas sp. X19]SCC93190.1 hypothetical protein THIX_30418 [Thiomonas sp. X19]
MTVPEHVAVQLGFDTTEVSARADVLADSSRKLVPIISRLRVRLGNRFGDLSAPAQGDEDEASIVQFGRHDIIPSVCGDPSGYLVASKGEGNVA